MPALCDHVHLPVQSGSSRVLAVDVSRVHARTVPGTYRLDEVDAQQGNQHHHRHHRRIPGRDRSRVRETLSLLDEVGYDGVFAFKYSPRPNTPALQYADSIPEDEKSRRLQMLQEHQREIQRVSYRRHVGQTLEVMVEGKNTARGADDRTHLAEQNTEFRCGDGKREPPSESTCRSEVTQAFPNSLLGEMVG